MVDIHSFYHSLHENDRLDSVVVPDKSVFLDKIAQVEKSILEKKRLIVNKDFLKVYLEGYIDGVCLGLLNQEWPVDLVYKFISIYLMIKYLDKYHIEELGTWYKTFFKTLSEFYDESFVKGFLDNNLFIA